jgi:hypothetical protein
MTSASKGLAVISSFFLTRYPLLLREVLKKTPENHPDFKDANDALEKVEAVITIVNNRTQHLDQSQKLLLLQSSIESDEVPTSCFLNNLI